MKPVKFSLLFLMLTLISEKTSSQSVSDTIRFAQSILSMEKKKIVLEYLSLTEAEKSAFWPVYDSYTQATQYIEMESHQILLDFANDYNSLGPSDIEKFSKRILQNDLLLAKVRMQYFKKFKRAINAQLASEFMQLDNSLRMMLRYQVQRNALSLAAAQAHLHGR